MIKIEDLGIILEKTKNPFENEAVLNPECIREDNHIHMFYRAVGKDKLSLEKTSSIGYCKLSLKDHKVIERWEKPMLYPEFYFEKQGLEDPRITKIDDTYYLVYVGYDGKNARIAYATSANLKNWQKKGVLSPSFTYDEAENIFRANKLQERYFLFESIYKIKLGEEIKLWEKDAFLLPKKINNQFVLFHRILPGIQVIYFEKFEDLTDEYWRKYLKKLREHIVLNPKYWFESRNIGGGCVPIEVLEGWILIYHSVEDTNESKIYHASAALIDKNDPTKILGRLKDPFFSPKEKWELEGSVNNVVFPSASIVDRNDLIIYYGAADRLIAAKKVNLKELTNYLLESGT
ncbi:MAG: pesticidal protein Cry7Aa [Candidatus Moranbacteria bacterium]|nr:pesticidal protein Cry7Aa [Candidatus Moranbacteria bacterium]